MSKKKNLKEKLSPKPHITKKKVVRLLLKELNQKELLEINDLVQKRLKKLSKRNEKLKKVYIKHKKARDTNLYFIKCNEKGQWRIKTYYSKEFKPNKLVSERAALDVPPIIWKDLKSIKNTSSPNIYIVYLPGKGLGPLEKSTDFVYIGEVRHQSTGGYREVLERFSYSGHDHGSEERKLIKMEVLKGYTRIDSYLAEFNFETEFGYVFLTNGKEKDLIKYFKEESTVISNKFIVVNK